MLDNLNSKFESSRVQALDVNDDEVEIDLLEIFHALRKKILLVLMVALIGGCIGAACTQFLMTPIYSSTSSMLVLSKETTLTSLADLQLGASLTSDYTVLITSTPVLEQVVTNLNLDMTAENLKENVTINNPTDTRILEITVDTERTSPSVMKNSAIGFLLGFLACAAIVVVYAVMDDTIKTEEDIEKYLGVSVLAKVPDRKDYVNMKNKKPKSNKKNKKRR